MGKANLSRQALIEAIASLESQRREATNDHDLDRAVRTALAALRQKLVELQSPSDPDSHLFLAILVADLSGFTAFSEHMDAENVHDALNAMWQVLDGVILAWGGSIDQHAGDSLLALFGLPYSRGNDIFRAVQAALAIQFELDLFNKRVEAATDDNPEFPWSREWPSPRMRIGIHAGPVYFARVPGGGRTAVGDSILMGRRMEKMAPVGRVLASHFVYQQVRAQFHMEAIAASTVSDASSLMEPVESDEAYIVVGERVRPVSSADMIAGERSRLVGRAAEIDELQLALQMAGDIRTPQLVSIIGRPGMGKSVLIQEFEQQSQLFGESFTVLRAVSQQPWPATAYSLIRDLLLRRLSIRAQHSRHIIEAKIRRALVRITPAGTIEPADETITWATELLLQLLDAKAAATLRPNDIFALVVSLFENITSSGPAVLIIDQLHRADRPSIELIDQLMLVESELPILILCSVEDDSTHGPQATVPWLGRDEDPFSPAIRLKLAPLSPVDARLMVTDMIKRLSPLPMRLVDLIVAESQGNPLYIEFFIRWLVERGLLTIGETWRADMAGIEDLPLPNGLENLIRMRIASLSPAESLALQYASVIGYIFWDEALFVGQEADNGSRLGETEIEVALLSLEKKHYILPDTSCSFSNIQAYAFERPLVRDVIYAMIPESERVRLHRQTANWLMAVRNEMRSGVWLPSETMIAWHLSQAGDNQRAAAWRQGSELVNENNDELGQVDSPAES